MTPHNLSEPEADRQLEEGGEVELFECYGMCGTAWPATKLDKNSGLCPPCREVEQKEAERAAEVEHARQEMLRDAAEGR